MTDWDSRYLLLAQHVAEWSKDPNTKVGAVIVGKDRRRIAFGYNGFPRGIADDHRLGVRVVKHTLIQHAERNALDNAQFDLEGALLVTTMHPCSECAKSIVSRGITRVVCPPRPDDPVWAARALLAAEIFEEAGVQVCIINK